MRKIPSILSKSHCLFLNFQQIAAKKETLPVRVWNTVKNPKELWQMIKKELLHYYHGFKLFGLEAKISVKYVWRLIRGQNLNRRERQQVWPSLKFTRAGRLNTGVKQDFKGKITNE